MTIQYLYDNYLKSIILREGLHQYANIQFVHTNDIVHLQGRCYINLKGYSNCVILARLYVAPPFQQQGYATYLLNEYVKFVKSINADFIGVLALSDNDLLPQKELVKFYMKVFDQRGTIDEDGTFLYSINIQNIKPLNFKSFKFEPFIK